MAGKKRFSRNTAIAFVFSLVILLIIGGMNYIVPIIRRQLASLIEIWPTYWDTFIGQVEALLNTEVFSDLMIQTEDSSFIETLTNQTSSVLNATVGGIGNVIGTITPSDHHAIYHAVRALLSPERRKRDPSQS
ncbi:MAG: AI-2E family transporter [Alkalibacterium sp.]|nr:AI-2E family transporter [Alkalibacterium sp.]